MKAEDEGGDTVIIKLEIKLYANTELTNIENPIVIEDTD